MIKSFLRHYLELPQKGTEIVCLGGGVGTAQVLKGLRNYPYQLTTIVSMADDGGSAGRLRRAFAVPPPGDLVNCLAALSEEENIWQQLFLYRFAGERYGNDTDLGGQKLGNLIFVALSDICKGDTNMALEELSKIVSPRGRVLPATVGDVNIWATTEDDKKVYGEENIDLGRYNKGKTPLKEVHLDPENAKAYKPTIEAIKNAQTIIVGPGDLFSTILPVLIVPQIKSAFINSKAQKIFVVNITNKPFETTGFKVSDYVTTVLNHLNEKPKKVFDKILVNTNYRTPIPKSLKYKYVEFDKENLEKYGVSVEVGDFVNQVFPLYHDSEKMAVKIKEIIR